MEIGHDVNGIPIHIPDYDRDRHVHIDGQTGTGKSALIENMIASDLADRECVIFIDPHGVSSETVVRHIPDGRDFDLIYLRPAYLQAPISINLLANVEPDDRPGRAGDIVAAFVDFFGEQAVGDRSQQVLRNSLLALMETPGTTLLGVIQLLRSDEYRAKTLDKVTDPLVISYWRNEFDLYSDQKRSDVVAPILNKLDALFSYPAIRHTLGQAKSTVQLDEVIERKQILIVNLRDLADGADSVFGGILISLIWSTMRRRAGRSRVRLYIDEFPRVATGSIEVILSEARKMKLELTLGHQYWGQVPKGIQDAVYGNAGTLISFRVGANDAPLIATQFNKTEKAIRELSNYNAFILPTGADAIRFETNPPREPYRGSAASLIANSINHFGTQRSAAELEVRTLFT